MQESLREIKCFRKSCALYELAQRSLVMNAFILSQFGYCPVVWIFHIWKLNTIWKIMPRNYKELTSLSTFKSKIKNWVTDECLCRLCKTFMQELVLLNWAFIRQINVYYTSFFLFFYFFHSLFFLFCCCSCLLFFT